MLSPKLTNCKECANIPDLLRKIDCKLAELGNNLYNNVVFMLHKPIANSEISQLLVYKRVFQDVQEKERKDKRRIRGIMMMRKQEEEEEGRAG